ncbi:hypothetical protein G6F68_016410 [Rhizopus microsporus]|nr:hypothetical protein G6F68_016410 [Rhizopus microsporus]
MALGAGTALSTLISATGTILGVTLGANTDKLDYVLDIGNGTVDTAIAVTGRNVIIRGQSFSVNTDITLDAAHTLRLEGEKITVGATTGANIVLAAGAHHDQQRHLVGAEGVRRGRQPDDQDRQQGLRSGPADQERREPERCVGHAGGRGEFRV